MVRSGEVVPLPTTQEEQSPSPASSRLSFDGTHTPRRDLDRRGLRDRDQAFFWCQIRLPNNCQPFLT